VSQLFVGLTPEEHRTLWGLASVAEFGHGSVLFRRGDPGTDLFVVGRGRVRIALGAGTPEEVTVAIIEPRGFFGELALLDGARRTADAVAEGDCAVLRIPREEFLQLVEQRPRVADRLVHVLTERARGGGDGAADPRLADAAGRFVGAVERVANRDGGTGVIEILPVFLRDGAIWGLRAPGEMTLRVAATGGGHPGDEVVKALRDYGIEVLLVHSTSWRQEHGSLVITYLAVIQPSPGAPHELAVVPVRRSELARGSATGPPPSIETDHVVEHALRHLSWLSRDDPVVRHELDDAWREALAPYEPEPFRSLGATGVTTAVDRT
jgi:CRP-like cAMP-binding protein